MTRQDPTPPHEPPAPAPGGFADLPHGSPYASDDASPDDPIPWASTDTGDTPGTQSPQGDQVPSMGTETGSFTDDGEEPHGEATGDSAEEADDPAAAEDPLSAALRERDEYLDALQRKQADFENFRKRMMRDGATQRIVGHAEVAERMLDVLDDFDRTLANATDVGPGFLKGVELVHDKLVGVLTDFGLTRIDEQDIAFDPNRHEAVQQQETDDDLDEPRVAQVLRPGYELGGRVLRAAMVVVEQ